MQLSAGNELMAYDDSRILFLGYGIIRRRPIAVGGEGETTDSGDPTDISLLARPPGILIVLLHESLDRKRQIILLSLR